MCVKNDKWLREKGREIFHPFEEKLIRKGVISFGVSSYGYDIRLGREFLIPAGKYPLDPKGQNSYRKILADVIKLPPHSHILGCSLEYVKIPRETIAICTGKSTYARCGIMVNITPLEPEWEGYITISISNTSSRPVFLYASEGIAQIIFLSAFEPCEESYRERKGKYHEQKSITPSKVE